MTASASPLRTPGFLLLWAGQSVSRFGDGLYAATVGWWVLSRGGAGSDVALVAMCGFLPMLGALPLSGWVVDRVAGLRALLLADVASAAVTVIACVLAWTEDLALWNMCCISAVLGLIEAFFVPAYMAAVPRIVQEHQLPSANALNSVSAQVARVLSPVVGAFLVSKIGFAAIMGLNACSFLVAVGCIVPQLKSSHVASFRADGCERPGGDRRQHAGMAGDALAFIRQRQWLWIAISVFGLINALDFGARTVAIPCLVALEFGSSVIVLGVFGSCYSIGCIIGALLGPRLTRIARPGALAYGGIAIYGILLAAIGLHRSEIVMAIGAIGMGVAIAAFGVVWNSVLQATVRSDVLGRVIAIDMLGSFALVPCGLWFAGLLCDRGAPDVALTVSGVVIMTLASLLAMYRGTRVLGRE